MSHGPNVPMSNYPNVHFQLLKPFPTFTSIELHMVKKYSLLLGMWVCGISYAEHTQMPQGAPVDSSITTKGYFSVYPNSKSASFQVILNDKELVGAASLKVKDAQGNVIVERNIQVNAGINMFGVTDYPFTPGTYFFYVEQAVKKTNTLKVVLQN